MRIANLGDVKLHYQIDGNPEGPPVVFANSLGTDLRLWDPIMPLLPQNLCYIRFDKRGHGLSELTPAPYSMGTLVRDTERLMDHLKVKNCVFVGLSIGGMIAQDARDRFTGGLTLGVGRLRPVHKGSLGSIYGTVQISQGCVRRFSGDCPRSRVQHVIPSLHPLAVD